MTIAVTAIITAKAAFLASRSTRRFLGMESSIVSRLTHKETPIHLKQHIFELDLLSATALEFTAYGTDLKTDSSASTVPTLAST